MRTLLHITLALIFAVCLTGSLGAQDPPVWKPVTLQELSMDKPVVEPDAPAEAIFWEVKLDDENKKRLYYEHYVRIKIFTELGREKYSKIDIKYNEDTRVDGVAARVIKPDGSIQVLGAAEIFDRDIISSKEVKIKAKSFAVPGIEPGVIVEYQYREAFKGNSLSGERFIFQRDIPVQRMTYKIRPYKESRVYATYFNTPDLDLEPDPEEEGFQRVTMNNVAAFTEEPFMAPEDTVRPWAYLRYAGYGTSWSSFGNDWGRGFDYLTKPDKKTRKKAEELVAGLSTDEQKIRRLYDFVQKEIRNSSYDKSVPSDVKKSKFKKPSDLLKRRYAFAFQVDILFAALLRGIGKAPALVLSPNRNQFFFNPNGPSSHAIFLNPSAISVLVDGKRGYFNPGTPYLPYGQLVWYEENVHVMLASGNGQKWMTIPLKDEEFSTSKRTGKFTLDSDGTLEGDVDIEITGYTAIDQRRIHFSDSDEKRLEELKEEVEEKFESSEVSKLSVTGFADAEKPLRKSYSVTIPNYTQKTGSRMFFIPDVFESNAKPLFTSSERLHPIYFRFPWTEIDEIEIKLPDDFVLENFTPPVNVEERTKLAGTAYTVTYDKDTHTLKYLRKFHMGANNKIIFPATAYKPLKTLFDTFHKSDTHTLALKRKG